MRWMFLLLTGQFLVQSVSAQIEWPHTFEGKNGAKLIVYQPQPEKLEGNVLDGRVAVALKQTASEDPVFGALWFEATMETDRDNRMASLKSIRVKDFRIPGLEDTAKINKIKAYIESEVPKLNMKTTLDEINTSVEEEQKIANENFKNDPPKIIYTNKPSILVLMDGEPKLKEDENLKMQRVYNTAFLIFQYPKNNQYYLYGGSTWYISSSITSGWKPVKNLPKDLEDLDKQIREQEKKQNKDKNASNTKNQVLEIVVATEPTELVQSEGEADFTSIKGTSLLYVKNSDDHIFMDIDSSKYYVLLSGRWYKAANMNGPWDYIASDKLPADFAKIPKGSDKDIVLASVAGTEEAEDAIMDAQIPQTAKVDRKKATCTVKYDGEPKFEKIEGTNLYLAQNTSSTVIRSDKTYYCVEDGIWFKSSKPDGPWTVSDERPKDVENIPASSEAYNIKYVYVYDSTPEYVYVGYTPGYMGCYVYGPTVVYGTGFYYNPWYGPYYYPRPVTFGFSMHYNPWTGWSMGFHLSFGFFGFHGFYGGYPGYWGPPVYRPPYYPAYRGGYYGGRGPTYIGGDVNINIDRSNNIYNQRPGVSTPDVNRPTAGQRPSTGQLPASGNANRPSTQPSNRPANNVMTDRQGNVYQKGQSGEWQQRDGNSWKSANNASTNDLNRQMENRNRSQNMNRSYNQTNRGGNMGGGYSRPSGGGFRGGGRRR